MIQYKHKTIIEINIITISCGNDQFMIFKLFDFLNVFVPDYKLFLRWLVPYYWIVSIHFQDYEFTYEFCDFVAKFLVV